MLRSKRPFGQRPVCAALLMAGTTFVLLLVAQALSAVQARGLISRADEAISEHLQLDGSQAGVDDRVGELLVRADPVEALWVAPASLSVAERALLGFCEREGAPPVDSGATVISEGGVSLLVRAVNEGALCRDVPGDATVLVFVDVTLPLTANEAARHQLLTALCVVGPMAGLAIWLGVRSASIARQRSREFFANAAHELRTPLVAIQGYAAGLQTGTFSQGEAVAVISEESERMGALVDNILSLSKVEAHEVVVRVAPCDACGEAADALDTLRPEAQRRSVDLRLTARSRLVFETDCELMRSMLLNIVSNAVRHAVGRIEMTVGEEDGGVLFCVWNDGEPPSDEALARAFDRFYSSRDGHTGIGMALVKEYAELLGGTVDFRRERGLTACRLWLPKR